MILFCHGLESAPHGRKYHAMVDAGLDVTAPDCRGKDLLGRVELIAAAIDEQQPTVVVGSSFGGMAGLLASLRARHQLRALVLCAPALQLPCPPSVTLRCPAPTTIIHGTRDDVIPVSVSRQFAQTHSATLIEVNDVHDLRGSMDLIVRTTRAALGPSEPQTSF